MYLIVGSTPQSGWQRLLPAFESAGCTVVDQQRVEEWCLSALQSGAPKFDKENRGATLDARLKKSASQLLNQIASPALFPVNEARHLSLLQAWLEEFPDAHLLLFHSRPESALADAMQQGDDPQKVLDEWYQGAEQLMNVHRRHRRRSLLVDAESAYFHPEAFARVCQERYGLHSKNPPEFSQSEKEPIQEIHKLIATQFVAQTSQLPELLAEMEASSLPLGTSQALPGVDCIEAHREFQQLKQQVENKLQDVEKENELLVLQLDQIQEELKCYQAKCQEETESREKAEQTVESQQKQLNEKEEACKENELLLLQLHQVQEELETYYLKYQEESEKRERAEQAVESTQRKLADAQKRLDLVWQSTSWKLTAPIRAVVLLFKKPFRKSKPATQKVTG